MKPPKNPAACVGRRVKHGLRGVGHIVAIEPHRNPCVQFGERLNHKEWYELTPVGPEWPEWGLPPEPVESHEQYEKDRAEHTNPFTEFCKKKMVLGESLCLPDDWPAKLHFDYKLQAYVATPITFNNERKHEMDHVAEAILKEIPDKHIEKEVVQIAAVAVAWLECFQNRQDGDK